MVWFLIVILIIVLVLGAIYLMYNHLNKKEGMADIPDEINKLLEESNESTYYSEEDDEDEEVDREGEQQAVDQVEDSAVRR